MPPLPTPRTLLRRTLDLLPAVWGLLLIRPLLIFGWLEEPFQQFFRGAVMSYPCVCLAWFHLRFPAYLRRLCNPQHRTDIRLSMLDPDAYLSSRLRGPAARLLLPLLLLAPTLAWLLHSATPHTLEGRERFLLCIWMPSCVLAFALQILIAAAIFRLACQRPLVCAMTNRGLAAGWIVLSALFAAAPPFTKLEPWPRVAPVSAAGILLAAVWTISIVRRECMYTVCVYLDSEHWGDILRERIRRDAESRGPAKLFSLRPPALRILALLAFLAVVLAVARVPRRENTEYLLMRNRDSAVQAGILSRAIHADPRNPKLWYEFAGEVSVSDSGLTYRDCIERALALVPASQFDGFWFELLIDYHFDERDAVGALRLADRIVAGFERVPGFLRTRDGESRIARYYYARGYILEIQGHRAAALADFELARRLHPDEAVYLEIRTESATAAGSYAEAVEFSTRAIETLRAFPADTRPYDRLKQKFGHSVWVREPYLARLYRTRAQSYFVTGDFERARSDLEDMIVAAPDWEGMYDLEIGLCLFKTGRTEEALAHWKASESGMKFGDSACGFALAHLEADRWREAHDVLDPGTPLRERYPRREAALLTAVAAEKLGLEAAAAAAWAHWDDGADWYRYYNPLARAMLPANCLEVFEAHEARPPAGFIGPSPDRAG